MTISSGLLQVHGQQVALLLDEGYLDRAFLLFLVVQEVAFVSQKNLHSVGGHKEDVSGVFINLTLKVQDLFWACQDGRLGGFCLRVLLEDLPVATAVQLGSAQKEEPYLIIVFLFQTLTKVREMLKGGHPGPEFPSGVLENRDLHLVIDVQG